jgi:hypothetical protein
MINIGYEVNLCVEFDRSKKSFCYDFSVGTTTLDNGLICSVVDNSEPSYYTNCVASDFKENLMQPEMDKFE